MSNLLIKEKNSLTNYMIYIIYNCITISQFLFLQLHIAAANGYLRVVEFLLDQHVSTDVEDNDKWQPVHAAACWGHVSLMLKKIKHQNISPIHYIQCHVAVGSTRVIGAEWSRLKCKK